MQVRCSVKYCVEPCGFSKPTQRIFNWQFWERASHDPKMTSYLTHGVKAKMCETTPFANSVGTQYVASRAQLEQACDSLRQQGSSRKMAVGLSSDDVCAPTTLAGSPSCTIVDALMVPPSAMWSTMVMHTHPFSRDLLQNVCPHHEVILSCKPLRPGCRQWRPLHSQVHDDIRELKPDVIVEISRCQVLSVFTRSIHQKVYRRCLTTIPMPRISLNLIRL